MPDSGTLLLMYPQLDLWEGQQSFLLVHDVFFYHNIDWIWENPLYVIFCENQV